MQSCATGTLADEDQRRMMLIKSVGHSSYLIYFAQLYTSTPSSEVGRSAVYQTILKGSVTRLFDIFFISWIEPTWAPN